MVNVECNGKPIMGSPFPVFFSAGTHVYNFSYLYVNNCFVMYNLTL